MELIDTFQNSIDLKASEIYDNVDKLILQKVRDIYEGKCFNNRFIIEVLEILRRSTIMCNTRLLNGSCYVNVMFRARCYVYDGINSIFPVVISEFSETNIKCNIDHGIVSIKKSRRLAGLKKDDVIAIKIINVLYEIERDNIIIAGEFYFHNLDVKINYVESIELTEEEQCIIDDLLEKCNVAKKKMMSTDKDILKFISDVMYPFSQKIEYTNFEKTTFDKLLSAPKKFTNKFIFRHPVIPMDSSEIYFCDQEKLIKSGQIINPEIIDRNKYRSVNINRRSYFDTVALILEEILENFELLANMTDWMKKNNISQDYILWNIYNLNKRKI